MTSLATPRGSTTLPQVAFHRNRRPIPFASWLGGVWLLFLAASPLLAQGTGFLFEGRLSTPRGPASGLHDLAFRLLDTPTGGSQIGPVETRSRLDLVEGVFSTRLIMSLLPTRWVVVEAAERLEGSPALTVWAPVTLSGTPMPPGVLGEVAVGARHRFFRLRRP